LDMVYKYLNQNQVTLFLTDVKYPVIKLIKRSHLMGLIGAEHIFQNVFQAHMHILARLKLARGENLLADTLYDYTDEKGANRINFDGVNLAALERPLTDREKALILQWDPFDFEQKLHPLSREKKGFKLKARSLRVSLAPLSEKIPVRSHYTINGNLPLKHLEETPVQGA